MAAGRTLGPQEIRSLTRYPPGLVRPPRQVAPAQAIVWILALAGSATAFSWALLLFFADREQRAATFTIGGLALVLWAALHLTDYQHTSR